MRYLLDTCAFIDAVTEPDNLGTDVCALMEDYENEFCISIETIREVILKVGSINSLCQIFDLSLSAECQFLRERCGHRDR